MLSDNSVHELPEDIDSSRVSAEDHPHELQVIVNTALIARIEALESENNCLKKQLASQQPKHYRLEIISHDDSLVCFYTGFQSIEVLFAFYEFLGLAVNNLLHWGGQSVVQRKR